MQIESYKQCIGGAIYDTTNAELIGWIYDNSIVDSDFEGIKRHLMLRADGRFFMFSLFGTMSKRPIGQIVPMTTAEARRWCELNLINLEKVNGVFGNVSVDVDAIAA